MPNLYRFTNYLDRILGDVRIVAADRTETKVEVRPSDPSKPADVRGAAKPFVDCFWLAGGQGARRADWGDRRRSTSSIRTAGSRVEAQLTWATSPPRAPWGTSG